MYERFYLLERKPFEDLPATEFPYLSKKHNHILAALSDALNKTNGAILIAGVSGTGKTTLLHTLINRLNSDIVFFYIDHPRSDIDGIMVQLAQKLSIYFIEQSNIEELNSKITSRLEQLERGGKQVVLIIEEAHRLDERCLADIRRCFRFEVGDRPLLQMVLTADSAILHTLQHDSLKPSGDWLPRVFILEALKRKEVKKYIEHRLHSAGRRKPLFNRRALFLIWRKSAGIPRVINQICENALIFGYALRCRKISGRIISKVAAGIDSDDTKVSSFHTRKISLWKVLLIFVISLFILLAWTGSLSKRGTIAYMPKDKTAWKAAAAAPVKPANVPSSRPLAAPKTRNVPRPVRPNPCLVHIAQNHYGVGNETIIDLVQAANPTLRNIAGDCTEKPLVFPQFRKTDLIDRHPDGTFLIHYASFYTSEPAVKLMEELKAKYPNVSTVTAKQGENVVFRVYLNKYTTLEKAQSALARIEFSHLPFLQRAPAIKDKALLDILKSIQ